MCSFAASDDAILPLKSVDVATEKRVIHSCLTILFSSPSVTRFQPWDSYIFPPEIVELVFLDVKACAGDVSAATLLNAKTELARNFSHLVYLRFLESDRAALNVLPSTPQLFDDDEVAFVNVEIRGVPSLTINIFAIECAFEPHNQQPHFTLIVSCRYESYCKAGSNVVDTTFSVATRFSGLIVTVLTPCDQVEGLHPLWNESVLFDHPPYVFHHETLRYCFGCNLSFNSYCSIQIP